MVDNFKNEKDNTEFKEVYYNKCVGSNNRKTILLTFNCAKLLFMIYRSEKANMIIYDYILLIL